MDIAKMFPKIAAGVVLAQAPVSKLEFEVVSIKRAQPLRKVSTFWPGRPKWAYPVHPLTGGPLGAGAPADAASDPSSSSIFTAVQQLGLKLEPRKAPIEMIVVDYLEKTPTDN
jgi:hypothetical protein